MGLVSLGAHCATKGTAQRKDNAARTCGCETAETLPVWLTNAVYNGHSHGRGAPLLSLGRAEPRPVCAQSLFGRSASASFFGVSLGGRLSASESGTKPDGDLESAALADADSKRDLSIATEGDADADCVG